jgi:regulator of replication initiation timing
MKKVILLFLLTIIGITVSCEKSDWLSPEDVDNIKNQLNTQITELQFDNVTLTTQVTDLTTQVTNLTTEVASLETSVSTLTESNTTLTAENATVQTLTDNVTDLTTQVATLTSDKEDLDAQIVSLTTSNTTLTTDNTSLLEQVTTLTASVTSLQSQVDELETQADLLEAEILTFKNFKSLRQKLDTMVAATITDTNLNSAIDSISIGLTSSSVSSSVLEGLISTESDWLFNNAVKSGTVSMTTNVSTFYDTSTDTNVVNFRTLVEELTTAWNSAKETTLILWFIEFVKEFENL